MARASATRNHLFRKRDSAIQERRRDVVHQQMDFILLFLLKVIVDVDQSDDIRSHHSILLPFLVISVDVSLTSRNALSLPQLSRLSEGKFTSSSINSIFLDNIIGNQKSLSFLIMTISRRAVNVIDIINTLHIIMNL